MKRRPIVVGLVALTAAALPAGGVAFLCASRATLSQIPLPGKARDVVERYTLLGLRREVSFAFSEEYPSSSVREFYDEWARSKGWAALSEAQDPWSTDRWQSFVDASGQQEAVVDQWLVRWRSADSRWDLRLVLRYERAATETKRPPAQVVHLAASRISI